LQALEQLQPAELSARKVGATVFFAPVDNADEISNVPDGIKVVTVATLAQAINYLERSGR
jgi:PDZ domain-containing secreted protein